MILRKRLSDTEALLATRKRRKNERRIDLKDTQVFSTPEVLENAKEAGLLASNIKGHRQPRKQIDSKESIAMKKKYFGDGSIEDESDRIVDAIPRLVRSSLTIIHCVGKLGASVSYHYIKVDTLSLLRFSMILALFAPTWTPS
jgi:hypothetical protein